MVSRQGRPRPIKRNRAVYGMDYEDACLHISDVGITSRAVNSLYMRLKVIDQTYQISYRACGLRENDACPGQDLSGDSARLQLQYAIT